MVYVYKKQIGKKEYYYLRASVKKGAKIITKDIAYLGSSIEEAKKKLVELPSKYSKEIRKAYKTINKFLESNYYLEKVKSSKIKLNPYLNKSALESLESCRAHWITVFKKLDPKTKSEIFKNFIIEFAFNTASIEGNTITLEEAKKLLTENLTPKNRTLREVFDLQNTDAVFFELQGTPNKKISHELICHIHDSLLKNIDERKGYRTVDVRVFKMKFESTPAPYVLTDMNLLLEWYRKNEKKLYPFVLAVIFHHKFEKIHPFMDGNGRTGRMLMNYILLSKEYPPVIVRKKDRSYYLNELNKADTAGLTDSSAKYYRGLAEFTANELAESYWNIFL